MANELFIGVVIDCRRLRIRDRPSTDFDVICEVDSGSELMVDESQSTEDFYKVCTPAGIEGFCLKQFVSTTK